MIRHKVHIYASLGTYDLLDAGWYVGMGMRTSGPQFNKATCAHNFFFFFFLFFFFAQKRCICNLSYTLGFYILPVFLLFLVTGSLHACNPEHYFGCWLLVCVLTACMDRKTRKGRYILVYLCPRFIYFLPPENGTFRYGSDEDEKIMSKGSPSSRQEKWKSLLLGNRQLSLTELRSIPSTSYLTSVEIIFEFAQESPSISPPLVHEILF